MGIYLDNSATTEMCKTAKEKMIYAMDSVWGNPSSFHKKGIDAWELTEQSREIISQRLCCLPEEIYFTPGGTYSDNIALFGAAEKMKHRGNKIITTSVEHPAVENVLKKLEKQGFSVVRLPVDEGCHISKEDIIREIDENTVLISIMLVNNETGSVFPVDELKKIVRMKNSPALIHCDAVQGFGKIPINLKKYGVDMLSISSHKIHGPKGIGALYIKKDCRISPVIFGGGQEKDIAPGTQAVYNIAGFSGAVSDLPENLLQEEEKIKNLRDGFLEKLRVIPGFILNSPEDASPYILNFSILGIPSQPMITFLSGEGIYISGGSACARGHRSTVLSAMGISPERTDSALRLSFSRFTTGEELAVAAEKIREATEKLRHN